MAFTIIYLPYILNLAIGGLLSILKFDMGAYWRGGGLSESCILYTGFFRTTSYFACYDYFRFINYNKWNLSINQSISIFTLSIIFIRYWYFYNIKNIDISILLNDILLFLFTLMGNSNFALSRHLHRIWFSPIGVYSRGGDHCKKWALTWGLIRGRILRYADSTCIC